MRYCGPSRASDAKAFLRNGSELACWGEICGECYFDSIVAGYDVSLSRAFPLDERGPRDLRCFSAQSTQRVCSGMAGCWQSLHRPCSLSLLRFSTARALPRSCRSSGVRRTRFGFSDAFGFAEVVAGFETFRAGVRAASGLAGFFFLRFGSGSWS